MSESAQGIGNQSMELHSREHPSPITPPVEPFHEFIHHESTGGVLLLAATLFALVWANSPWAGLL
ncbi:MAG: Na+/H+ antiporter NhaA [Nitrospiraceae bacterium]